MSPDYVFDFQQGQLNSIWARYFPNVSKFKIIIVLPRFIYQHMRQFQIVLTLFVLILSKSICGQSDSLQFALKKLTTNGKQTIDTTDNPQLDGVGRINTIADSSIVQLERKTRGFKEIRGYRIQVMLGSIENIKTERNKFLSLNLPYSAYLKQVVPEYSLQVGDFTTKLEVERHLQIVREYYPKAFAVVETIEPQKFSTRK